MLYDYEKALKSTEERIKRDIPLPDQDLIWIMKATVLPRDSKLPAY